MTIGTQATAAGINQAATNLILAARNDLQAIVNFNAYLQGLGLAGLTATPEPGFTQADAQNLLSLFGLLSGIAAIANGQPWPAALPPLPIDIVAETVPLWAAQ